VEHQLKILVQERLALGAIGDDELDAGRGFDVGRKARAAGADYACCSDLFCDLHGPLVRCGKDTLGEMTSTSAVISRRSRDRE